MGALALAYKIPGMVPAGQVGRDSTARQNFNRLLLGGFAAMALLLAVALAATCIAALRSQEARGGHSGSA